MVNVISVRANLRIHGKIARKTWARLWYLLRAIDKEGSGRVKILVSQILILLGISKAAFYRWVKVGKADGAFRGYRRIDKDTVEIVLGSKTVVCENLGITDWESTTEIPLWQLFNNAELPLWKSMGIKPNRVKLRQQVTFFQAHWMQRRSIEAAKEEERKRIRKIKNRSKVYLPKFRGSNGKLVSQIKAARCVVFSRKHLPSGASQEGIGNSLGVTDQTARLHLRVIEAIQVMYKVEAYEAEAELFYDQETGAKSHIFKRKGEYYRYGTNLYNLNFRQPSEFTQRLKYKFRLLSKEIPLEAIQWEKNKDTFCTPMEEHFFLTKHEILEKLTEKYDLDSLDRILIPIYWELKTRSFGKFMRAVKEELRRMRIEEYRRARAA